MPVARNSPHKYFSRITLCLPISSCAISPSSGISQLPTWASGPPPYVGDTFRHSVVPHFIEHLWSKCDGLSCRIVLAAAMITRFSTTALCMLVDQHHSHLLEHGQLTEEIGLHHRVASVQVEIDRASTQNGTHTPFFGRGPESVPLFSNYLQLEQW